jgi:hypothetical protein
VDDSDDLERWIHGLFEEETAVMAPDESDIIVTHVFMNNARQVIGFHNGKQGAAFTVGKQAVVIYTMAERKPDVDGKVHIEFTHILGQRTEAE